MDYYEKQAQFELKEWQDNMQSKPSFLENTAKEAQSRINNLIPDRIHDMVTRVVRETTRTVIFGAGLTREKPFEGQSLEEIEGKVRERIGFYSSTAAAEGAITGYGGFFMGLADIALWLSIKMKLLFDMATFYGHDVMDYKERIFLLHIFQITFTRQKKRNEIYQVLANWDQHAKQLPDDIKKFDWKAFQLDYRDYLDLAKLLQLIPGFGAIVGFYVNRNLTRKLGENAINAYRMRRDLDTTEYAGE